MGFNNGYESGYEDAKAELMPRIRALEAQVAGLGAGGGGSTVPVTPSVQMVYSSFTDLASNTGDTGGLPSGIYNAMSDYLNGLTAKPSDPYAIDAEAFGTEGFYTSFIEIDIDGLMGPNVEFAPDVQVVFPTRMTRAFLRSTRRASYRPRMAGT